MHGVWCIVCNVLLHLYYSSTWQSTKVIRHQILKVISSRYTLIKMRPETVPVV